MIDWDSRPGVPRWRQVADIIIERIERGIYKPGMRIPSVKDLQDEFGIAVQTAQKAMTALRAEGYTLTSRGMGSYVKPREAEGK